MPPGLGHPDAVVFTGECALHAQYSEEVREHLALLQLEDTTDYGSKEVDKKVVPAGELALHRQYSEEVRTNLARLQFEDTPDDGGNEFDNAVPLTGEFALHAQYSEAVREHLALLQLEDTPDDESKEVNGQLVKLEEKNQEPDGEIEMIDERLTFETLEYVPTPEEMMQPIIEEIRKDLPRLSPTLGFLTYKFGKFGSFTDLDQASQYAIAENLCVVSTTRSRIQQSMGWLPRCDIFKGLCYPCLHRPHGHPVHGGPFGCSACQRVGTVCARIIFYEDNWRICLFPNRRYRGHGQSHVDFWITPPADRKPPREQPGAVKGGWKNPRWGGKQSSGQQSREYPESRRNRKIKHREARERRQGEKKET